MIDTSVLAEESAEELWCIQNDSVLKQNLHLSICLAQV